VQLAEIALANVVVPVVELGVIRAAANVNMILVGKVVCVVLVCPAADVCLNASWAVAKVVLEMQMGGARTPEYRSGTQMPIRTLWTENFSVTQMRSGQNHAVLRGHPDGQSGQKK
jgi:hypothetical protein